MCATLLCSFPRIPSGCTCCRIKLYWEDVNSSTQYIALIYFLSLKLYASIWLFFHQKCVINVTLSFDKLFILFCIGWFLVSCINRPKNEESYISKVTSGSTREANVKFHLFTVLPRVLWNREVVLHLRSFFLNSFYQRAYEWLCNNFQLNGVILTSFELDEKLILPLATMPDS